MKLCKHDLFQFLGKNGFRKIAHHVAIGNQIIVRGFHESLVTSAIKALEVRQWWISYWQYISNLKVNLMCFFTCCNPS